MIKYATHKYLLFFLCVFSLNLWANEEDVNLSFKGQKKDTAYVNHLLKSANFYSDKQLAKSMTLANKSILVSKEINYILGQANGLVLLAEMEQKYGNIDLAINHLKQANKFFSQLEDEESIASINNKIGYLFAEIGNFENSINYFQKSINYFQNNNSEIGLAKCYSDLGWINFNQKNLTQALNKYENAKNILEKQKQSKELALLYNRIGAYYHSIQDYETSLNYNYNALLIQERLRNKSGIALSNYNIALSNLDQNNIKRARGYIEFAVKIYKEIEDKFGIVKTYIAYAELERRDSNLTEAESLLDRAISIAKSSQAEKELSKAYYSLSNIYFEQNKLAEAYDALKTHSSIKDNLNSTKKLKSFSEMQVKLNVQAKEKKLEEVMSEKEKQDGQIFTYLILLFSAVGMFTLILFFQFKRNKLRKEVNKFLSKKNEIIEKKNKEIFDSLMYAKRIQDRMLTPKAYLDKIFPKNFLMYIPKDIVSGDFYWAYHDKTTNKKYWVIADCTGHGVPGALMSMIGTVMLNEIIITNKNEDPNKILTLLSKNFTRYLNKNTDTNESTESKEGMALTLCVFDLNSNTLSFAGATNSVIVVRKNELFELKGDQIFIGYDPYERKIQDFTVSNFELKEGDFIYGFTDGYADQIGFDSKKKFKIGVLKKVFIEISNSPAKLQQDTLTEYYKKHKGKYVQLDDILIMGIQV